MRLLSLVIPATLVAAAFLGVSGASSSALDARAASDPLETIHVPATTAFGSLKTSTVFDPSRTYRFVVSGTVTYANDPTPQDPTGGAHSEDALYCFSGMCPGGVGVRGAALGVVTDCQGCASGIDNLSNTLVRIPYTSSHLYDVTFTGRSGRMTLYSRGYARGGGSGDYTHVSGEFTVEIFEVETGTTKTVAEPAPGGTKFVESPAIPSAIECGANVLPVPKGCNIFTDDQAGGQDPRGTIIAAEGDLERAPTVGEFVFWCWLNYDFTNSNGAVVHLPAKYQLGYCINMALYLYKRGKLGNPKPPAVRLSSEVPAKAEAAGCRTKAIPILLRKRGHTVRALGRAKKAKLNASSVRYSCSASTGKATITITAPRGLRKSLGKHLDLMVARAKNAPRRAGKLSITFGWK